MTRLHVLTACTRPENLAALAASIAAATCEPWEVCWHVRFDLGREHVGGQKLKNDMLDQIRDGWVYVLDDDTVVHPELFKVVALSSVDAVVVSQVRADGRFLQAGTANVRVGHIDIGQAVLKRSLIGDQRLPLHYEGDGVFLASVLAGASRVVYVQEALSSHNALEQVAA